MEIKQFLRLFRVVHVRELFFKIAKFLGYIFLIIYVISWKLQYIILVEDTNRN